MKRYYYILLLSTFVFNSCSKYLDVEPKSSMSENQIFASEDGFERALTGIYSLMSKQELYGDRLSLGFVSALAQNYTQSAAGAPYYNTVRYNYSNDEVRNYILQVWGGSYNAIAGLNKILAMAETNRALLSKEGYNMIRGEALALRAYIHFDLFRLFGPEYLANKSSKSIPYETRIDAFANVPSTSEEFGKAVLDDIAKASLLLQESDPILKDNGATNSRRIRLNYYAVKALEARVHMYIGNNDTAALAAKEVVEASKFPFVAISAVNTTAAAKDRLFTSELVFALRSRNMLTWTEQYFKFYTSAGTGLTRSLANINTIYESFSKDIRRQYLFEQDQNVWYPSKYWQTYVPAVNEGLTSVQRRDQLIPLIRLSEMYYILAETTAAPEQAVVYLDLVRAARGIDTKLPQNITKTALESEIQKEYHKEFYGEGQFFYYLKRKNITRIPLNSGTVQLSIYKLPIPDVELEYNPTYE